MRSRASSTASTLGAVSSRTTSLEQDLLTMALFRAMRVDGEVERGPHEEGVGLLNGLLALVAGQADPGFLDQVLGVVLAAAAAPQGGFEAGEGRLPVQGATLSANRRWLRSARASSGPDARTDEETPR